MHKQHSFCSIQFLLKYLNVRGRFWKKNFCVLGISNYDSFFFQVRFLLDFVLRLVTITKAWMIRKKMIYFWSCKGHCCEQCDNQFWTHFNFHAKNTRYILAFRLGPRRPSALKKIRRKIQGKISNFFFVDFSEIFFDRNHP